MKSLLLDRGQAILEIYPEVTMTNSRGDLVKMPGLVPIKVRASISRDRNASAELPGQVDIKIMRVLARTAPTGAWSRIVYDGEEWDLASPPHFGVGVSRATRSVSFTIRSRNDAAADGDTHD